MQLFFELNLKLMARSGLKAASCFGLVALMIFVSSSAYADAQEKAFKLHNRLTGVPPTPEVLQRMASLIGQGDKLAAARLAIETPHFYNVTLKRWASSWTNVDESRRAPLNDYTATVVGMVRDDLSFDRILFDDIIYVGSDDVVANPQLNIPAFATDNNEHYIALENQRIDLKESLVRRSQSALTGNPQPAGVMTTRTFGESYFLDGTNRRAIRFTLMTFLCEDLEQLHDNTIPDFRVRRDVERDPGGDSKDYVNNCSGCHAGMDALGGAFAYYDFLDGELVYTEGQVVNKMNRNASMFPEGHITSNDSWMNLWTAGVNARIGWHGADSGRGAAELGRMLSQTDAFSSCMARRTFEQVCLRSATTADDRQTIATLASGFSDNYNVKDLFAATSLECLGD